MRVYKETTRGQSAYIYCLFRTSYVPCLPSLSINLSNLSMKPLIVLDPAIYLFSLLIHVFKQVSLISLSK